MRSRAGPAKAVRAAAAPAEVTQLGSKAAAQIAAPSVVSPASADYDYVVVGGGHNGLVAAATLAAAGLKVTALERRGQVGGAAATEEFHPGFRNSVAAYTVSLLNPKIVRDLENLGENEVTTETIGETVMAHLRDLDDVAYVRFASVYRNFREARDFNTILGELEAEPEPEPPAVESATVRRSPR